jgi:hypothetical protein
MTQDSTGCSAEHECDEPEASNERQDALQVRLTSYLRVLDMLKQDYE